MSIGTSVDNQLMEAKKTVYKLLKELIGIEFYSQATQDVFVLKALHEKTGYYLEIGAGHPFESNNTYLLEKEYGWKGVSIEINSQLAKQFKKVRNNNIFVSDALSFDYEKHLKMLDAPRQIDYLSLDIDPSENSYLALEKLPHKSYRFSIITFEHDRYRSGNLYMKKSRDLLTKLGYKLVVSNVKNFGRAYEDWWVDPKEVKIDTPEFLSKSSHEFSELWLSEKRLFS